MKKVSFVALTLGALLVFALPAFADGDLYFVSPKRDSVVDKKLVVQIKAPPKSARDSDRQEAVQVWIKQDRVVRDDRIVWEGEVTSADDYRVEVDTSDFDEGWYEVNVEYYANGRVYDADRDFKVKH